MERFFQILAIVLGITAAYLLWNGSQEVGFVAAVFSTVAFLLSIRAQVKARNLIRETERAKREP